MTETTMNKISAVKNSFNFGVEVEMAEITRKNAAKLAARFHRGRIQKHTGDSFEKHEWKFGMEEGNLERFS